MTLSKHNTLEKVQSDTLITVPAFAALAGVSPSTAMRWLRAYPEELPAFRVGERGHHRLHAHPAIDFLLRRGILRFASGLPQPRPGNGVEDVDGAA